MNSFKIYFSDKNNIPGFFKLFSHHIWDIESTDFPQDIVLTTLGGGVKLSKPPTTQKQETDFGKRKSIYETWNWETSNKK